MGVCRCILAAVKFFSCKRPQNALLRITLHVNENGVVQNRTGEWTLSPSAFYFHTMQLKGLRNSCPREKRDRPLNPVRVVASLVRG